MAMTLDPAPQSGLDAEIDYDMIAEHDGAHADLEIDIELDGVTGDNDVDVKDVAHHDTDDLHYDDEIMHEENDAQPKYEMWEQEQQEADQDMDDTVYHEAEDHVIDQRIIANEADDVDVGVGMFGPAHISASAFDQTLEDGPQKTDDPSTSQVLSKQSEVSVAESVATSVTLEAGSGELETHDAADADGPSMLAQAPQEEEEPFYKTDVGEEANAATAAQDLVDESEEFAEDPALGLVPAAQELESAHVHIAKGEAEDAAQTDENDASQSVGDGQQEGSPDDAQRFEEQSTDEIYNAKVNFQCQQLQLFPGGSDNYHAFLLQDVSLAERPVVELLSACRAQLAEAVRANQVLGLEVRGLGLTILETDDDCSEITLSQIIDVYHHLHSNEEAYDPEQLSFELTLRSRPLDRLNELFQAAEAGKGYSALEQMLDDRGDGNEGEGYSSGVDLSDPVGRNESVEEDQSVDDNDVVEENDAEDNKSDIDDKDEEQSLAAPFVDDLSGATQNEFTAAIGLDDNVHEDTGEPLGATTFGFGQGEASRTENELQAAEDFETEDLIDYTDDEEGEQDVDHEVVAATNDAEQIAAGSAADDNVAGDDAGPHSLIDGSEIQPESVNEKRQESHADQADEDAPNADTGDAFLGTIAAPELLSATQGQEEQDDDVAKYDDMIDFGLGAGDDEPADPSKQSIRASSPSGKRTWDEHAADEVAVAREHDPKRVRSDG